MPALLKRSATLDPVSYNSFHVNMKWEWNSNTIGSIDWYASNVSTLWLIYLQYLV
jgi:hypothetical protein